MRRASVGGRVCKGSVAGLGIQCIVAAAVVVVAGARLSAAVHSACSSLGTDPWKGLGFLFSFLRPMCGFCVLLGGGGVAAGSWLG